MSKEEHKSHSQSGPDIESAHNTATEITHATKGVKKESVAKGLDRDFKRMTYSRMIFTGVGNLILFLICLWIHWSLGAIFLVFWLFVLPYLDMRRIRKYEAENPPKLPKSSDFDDTPFDGKEKPQKDEDEDENWKSWDDWDEWKKPKE